jgi:hypothetical protein
VQHTLSLGRVPVMAPDAHDYCRPEDLAVALEVVTRIHNGV